MTAIDTWINELQGQKYSSTYENLRSQVDTAVAALKLVNSTLFPVVGSWTQGSVIFAGSSNNLTQDNAQFFWDDTNHRLGIGTATPGFSIDTNGTPTCQGLTTTLPGWYAQLIGDTTSRVRIGLNATDTPSLAFGPGNAVRDCFFERVGAANLRLGTNDAASPVAQTLSVQNVVTGTSNTAGVDFTIAGSQGTGTGAGGRIIFQVAAAGGSGSTPNALAASLTLNADGTGSIPGVFSASGVNVTNTTSVTNGFLLGAASRVDFFTSSTRRFSLNTTNLVAAGASGGFFSSGASSSTAPAFGPNQTDQKAGIGADTAGDVSIIADNAGTATEMLRVTGTQINVTTRTLPGTINGSGFTNGAGSSTGTLTNAPTSGNPTKWIQINDNGTNRNIPAW